MRPWKSVPGLFHKNLWCSDVYLCLFCLPITHSLRDFQYLIMNLGMSRSFGIVDLDHLTFPSHMKVDYIRVYQPKNAINIGCDPKDFPTKNYIAQCVYKPFAFPMFVHDDIQTYRSVYKSKFDYLGQ
jgi:hypothetical protein